METEKIIIALAKSIDVALFLSRELCKKVKPGTQAENIARLIRSCLNEAASATEAAVDDMSRQKISLCEDCMCSIPDTGLCYRADD